MAGLTDCSFRMLCAELGAALTYTELVLSTSVLAGTGARLWRLLELDPMEDPVAVQLGGEDPAQLADAARKVEEDIAPQLIDLNMGCPVPKVVSKGAGAALMRRPRHVEALVRATVDAVSVPVTAKIRAGWSDARINAVDVAQAIEAGGGRAVAVHARTRSQRHDGPVHLELLAQVRAAVSIPVIGNGGIRTADDALRMQQSTGVDAVMVARGAIGNPWIFSEIDARIHGRSWSRPPWPEQRDVIRRHLERAVHSFEASGGDAEPKACRFLRGHLIEYARALPRFGSFRQSLSKLDSCAQVMAALDAAARPNSHRDGPGRWSRPEPQTRSMFA
jgi:tRNA-dihydrouridine synthase B